MGVITFLRNNLKSLTYQKIITKLILAFVTVSYIEIYHSQYKFNQAEFFNELSFAKHLIFVFVIFLVLLLLVDSRADPYLLIPLLVALFIMINYQKQDYLFAFITSLAVGGFCFYYSDKIKISLFGNRITKVVCILCGCFLAIFVGGVTILRFLSLRAPNFDFGIFSQMYHYMSETMIPYTTCERDMLLSHFAVHFSPILYVALPIYMLFPHPATILAVQAFVVALGVFPLYLIAKHNNLSNNKTIAVIIMYVLHPSVISNNFYYFHENCFLTVLLLWMFYFAEKKMTLPTICFGMLTMFVKEDAPVYVLFFGLYLILSNKGKIKGSVLCVLSAIYFYVVTKLMEVYGNGIMSNRYSNFIFSEEGTIFEVVVNVIKNPTYVFTQILNISKLKFLILMLIPMALLPLFIRKPSRVVLLFPLLLLNLMTDYVYQFDIGFQYTYGSLAFLFYLTVLNIGDMPHINAKKLLLSGITASFIFFASVNLTYISSIKTYMNSKDDVKIITEALNTIPKEASIRSTTFFIPALWNRNEIYEYEYSDENTDYVVFDLRFSTVDYEDFDSLYHNKYEVFYYQEGLIVILKAKE